MMNRDLSHYCNAWYHPGRNGLVCGLWYITNFLFFKSSWCPCYGLKRLLLRCYGASIGKNVVVKPCVNIKYPWHLSVGDYSWIGEGVWIDNLADVTIGSHVCLSQGAMLLCGNHDYTKNSFDLKIGSIVLQDGAWVGAKAVVCPGVTMGEESVLAVNSVLTKNTSPRTVWQGNPAIEKKKYE